MKFSPAARAFDTRTEIQSTPELERVLALPRRVVTPEYETQCVDVWTAALRQPGGAQRLRPTQGVSLNEIHVAGGLVGPQRVGSGKLLTLLLAAVVLGAKRPVLLLPSATEAPVRERMDRDRKHWQIPRHIHIIRYEELGRLGGASKLAQYTPDLVLGDEAHFIKSFGAGRTNKVARYLEAAGPSCRSVWVSGTLIKDDWTDCAHFFWWALGANAPWPRGSDSDAWAAALSTTNKGEGPGHGALARFLAPGEPNTLDNVRRAVGRRVRETIGVVATSRDNQVNASLYIRGHVLPANATTEANFQNLRDSWTTPDGEILSEAAVVWEHESQIAHGYHLYLDPKPPPEYLEARRAHFSEVRDVCQRSDVIDTPEEYEAALRAGTLADPGGRRRALLDAWLVQKPLTRTFVQRIRWHDVSVLEWCAAWAKKAPGLIWVRHVLFAEELARRTGMPYYAERGCLAGTDVSILTETGKRSVIASMSAGTGLDGLDRLFWRNLIVDPPSSSNAWEQILGRTHRENQPKDAVEVDFGIGCAVHREAWRSAQASGGGVDAAWDQVQKIHYADVTLPSIPSRGARWQRTKPKGE